MTTSDALVTIGLPTYNGADRLERTILSVLGQDHPHLELVISDNASTDGTEQLCRDFAATDPRIVYHRQPQNVGAVANFTQAMRMSRGEFFRWIGDDDWIAPNCVSRSLRAFAADERLVLVTAQTSYTSEGRTHTARYEGAALGSDDPAERFAEMLRLLTESYDVIDPLYGMQRRSVGAAIPRPVLVREDELAAARYALAGPWAHVNEVLSHRNWLKARPTRMSRRFQLPAWRGYFANILLSRELLRAVDEAGLTSDQRRRARAAVLRSYVARQRLVVRRGGRKLTRLASAIVTGRS
ncbi:glycosyltransferase family 2 protein [Nonomuraea sp. NPDC005983]|uniref:glycosyltransferase family 2 protein n=1 Tax=Nonomuraea sp. NPDC005983 TaxID=3155595 RepID=UPI0033AF375E